MKITDDFSKKQKELLASRRYRIEAGMMAASADPAIVGSFALNDGLWSCAIFGEVAPSAVFFEFAYAQLRKARHGDVSDFVNADVLYRTFKIHIGIFISEFFKEGSPLTNELSIAMRCLAQGYRIGPPDLTAESNSLVVSTAALVALSRLLGVEVSDGLTQSVARFPVARSFQPLRDALLSIDGGAHQSSFDLVRTQFARALGGSDFKLGAVQGFDVRDLFLINTTAWRGDMRRGATSLLPDLFG